MEKRYKLSMHLTLLAAFCIVLFCSCSGSNDNVESSTKVESDTHVCMGSEWRTIKEATCTNDGERQLLCTCGKVVKSDILTAGHDEIAHEAKEATCTTIGWEAYTTCSRCDYSTYVEIPAGHIKVQHEGKEPSCSEVGWNTYVTCTRCDYSTYVEIPAAHDNIVHPAMEATCTAIGWDSYVSCSICGYTNYVKIPALGHDEIAHEAKEATCTTIGWEAYTTCSRCDYTTYIEIPAGHITIQHEGKEPTCSEIGWEAYATCSREGCEYNTYCEKGTVKHKYENEKCKWCDKSYGSIGLSYQFNDSSRTCAVTGIGTCTDSHVEISSKAPNGYTVTSIYYDAFNNCTQLTSIEIPKSVKTILRGAFSGCTNLIQKENGVSYVDKWVISCDTDVTNVSLRTDTIGIAETAFTDCIQLVSIEIPASLTWIGDDAFSHFLTTSACVSLERINFAENSQLESIGEYAFRGCKSLTKIELPSKITTIAYGTFSGCSGLTQIQIPESVKRIESYAFDGCSNLTNIQIPENVINIERDSFRGCTKSIEVESGISYVDHWVIGYSSTDITSANFRQGTVGIGEGAFGMLGSGGVQAHKKIESVVFPDSVKFINDYAFNECNTLIKVTFANNSQLSIIGYSAFSKTSLVSIEIPSKVTDISSAFSYCRKLTNVTFSGNSQILTIGSSAFNGCENLVTIEIPDTVQVIEANVFLNCKNLVTVEIPDSVQSIGERAFSGCAKLSTLTFPQNSQLHTIAGGAFYNCGALTTIIIPAKVTRIGASAFSYCNNLTSVSFEASTHLESIESYAFSGCKNLSSLQIPSSLRQIGLGVFSQCTKLLEIEDGISYVDNWLVDDTGSTENVILRPGTVGISDYAFQNSTLISITIPETVRFVGKNAFSGCMRLVEIYNLSSYFTVEKGTESNGYIGQYALSVHTDKEASSKIWTTDSGFLFYEDNDICYLLGYTGNQRNLTLPESCHGKAYDIYNKAFIGSQTLTSVKIPQGVTSIGTSAFYGCSGLTTVEIASSVTNIDNFAFASCEALTSITFANNSQLARIGTQAFFYCTSLKKFTIPKAVTQIDALAFYCCNNLTQVTFEQPNGWWYSSEADATSGKSFSASDLSSASKAAKYLKEYSSYEATGTRYWKRTVTD